MKRFEYEFTKIKDRIDQFTDVQNENQVEDSQNQSSASMNLTDSTEALMQRLQELEQTIERERHEYSLKLPALHKEREIDNQRLEQELNLNNKKLQSEKRRADINRDYKSLMKRAP